MVTKHGRWYLIRMLLYHTMDDRIEGVVIPSQDTLIGAELDVESTPSQGTTVYLRWQPQVAG